MGKSHKKNRSVTKASAARSAHTSGDHVGQVGKPNFAKAGSFGESLYMSGSAQFIPPTGLSEAVRNRRGMQVYTMSQVLGATGRDQDGRLLTWGVEAPYFYLTVQQRNEIFKLSAPVNGLVTGRMNYIGSRDWEIVPIRHSEDRVYEEYRNLYQIYQEYANSFALKHVVVKAQIVGALSRELPGLLPDLSNFGGCVARWRKSIKNTNVAKCDEIAAWLQEPNQGLTWSDFVKKVVYDLHIHGAASVYKQKSDQTGLIENFDSLPGGTVYRLKDRYFTVAYGFIQIVSGYEPQLFMPDECTLMEYMPSSTQSHSFVPLESLVNQIAEDLLFSRQMADFADGTKPPEKVLIVTNPNDPFADPNMPTEAGAPLDPNEQKRIEQKLNEPRKYPIITMSGNDAKVLDVSKENTMGISTERQRDIRELVGFVFGASNAEMSLTGSDSTNGRESSDIQTDESHEKGRVPVMRIIEQKITREIIPFRFGPGYELKFKMAKSERIEREIDALKLNNGEVTVNELREKYGLQGFHGDEYDKPRGAAPAPDGTQQAPLSVKMAK